MGEPTSDIRSKETTQMLNYAFNSFKLNTIIDENTSLGKIKIDKGSSDYATLTTKKSITELVSINDELKKYTYNIKVNNNKAPIAKGDEVGSVEIIDNEGLIVREEPLTIKETISKASFIQLFKKNMRQILSGTKN